MQKLIDANTFDELQTSMMSDDVIDELKTHYPLWNSKLIATIPLVYKFPSEINVSIGSPLHSSSIDAIQNLTQDTYKEFEVQLKKH